MRGGVVYYAPTDGIRALAADTGHLLWRLPTEGAPRTALAFAGGLAYVATPVAAGYALLALDARTGAMRWQVALQPDDAAVSVLADGGTVFAIAPGTVTAWDDSTGAARWRRATPSPSSGFQQMVVAAGFLYLSADGATYVSACGTNSVSQVSPTIAALRATDGALLWQTPMPVA